MIPMGASVIRVSADKVANWDLHITLKEGSLALLEHVAGQLRDPRWGDPESEVGSEWDDEPWGWFPVWAALSARREKVIGFWFKDPKHAVYFKLKWGGQ